MAKQPPRVHAQYHSERGQELLGEGFVVEAEHEFREAAALDQNNGLAHAGLAAVLQANGDMTSARNEARTALRLQPSAEAYLVLAQIDLRDNQVQSAAENLDRALSLEPNNATAAALRRTVQAQLAQKK
jgi:Flp pilus assembly protein TadD